MSGRASLSFILAALTSLGSGGVRAAEPSAFVLKGGDRVVLVGNALVEREQAQGYLETALTVRYPGQPLVFRNLGWSGDTVWGEARAAFDPPPIGYKRLIEQVKAAKPTVLILGYGGVESFEGSAGLPRFVAGLNTLLDDLAPLQARLVVLGPIRQEDKGLPRLDLAARHRDLRLYRDALKTAASQRNGRFVDLLDEVTEPLSTTDGLLPDDLGYWQLARRITRGLGLADPATSIEIGEEGKVFRFQGLQPQPPTEVSTTHVRFGARADVLPSPPPPPHPADGAHGNGSTLIVRNLAAGPYALWADNVDTHQRFDASELERGVLLKATPDETQVERLRAAIVSKNRLEFYRYRPQNETYLYGFRKHEQGRNAAEVVQFDPLVAAQEAEIVTLSIPKSHVFELRREEGNGSR